MAGTKRASRLGHAACERRHEGLRGRRLTDLAFGYTVQSWLESAAQGYLLGTEHGHLPGEAEPRALLENEALREGAIDTTVQLAIFERAALVTASGLVGLAPDDATRCFLAAQALDEARHLEVFRSRLVDLGVARTQLDPVIEERANPHLRRLTGVLLEKLEQRDFLGCLLGQNVFLEGLAGHVLELLHVANEGINPKFARTLAGVLADEGRHTRFGEQRVKALLRQERGVRAEFESMQRELSGAMLDTFAHAFRHVPRGAERARLRQELARRGGADLRTRPLWCGQRMEDLEPEELERRLADAVLGEWRRRLERIGLELELPAPA